MHSQRSHSLLSPSGASRWLACTPSAKLESTFPEKKNDAADEGTFAHELSELLLKKHFDLVNKVKFESHLKKLKNNSFYSAELHGHCTDFVAYVIERMEDHGEYASIELEALVDISEIVPSGSGHVDIKISSDHCLEIIDLKYGKGVKVEAHENKQLMLYAFGALRKESLLYDIKEIKMSIFQPRLNNYGTFSMSVEELEKWAFDFVKPKAELAFKGKGNFVAGDHCLFCKAKHQCKTLADHHMGLAKYEFEDPNKLTDQDIADILEKAPDMIKWANSIIDYALDQAVNHEKVWPGYKLVAGRSNRVLSNPVEIQKALLKAKIKKDLYLSEPQLLGIGALEKNIGADKLNQIAGKWIIKPEGKPTLVPEWDKRPAINSSEKSKEVFKDIL